MLDTSIGCAAVCGVSAVTRIFLGLAFALLLVTAPKVWANGASGDVRITQVNMPADGSFIRIEVQPLNGQAPLNPDNCSGGGQMLIRVLESSAASSRYVATVMTAFASGKTANFWLTGCTPIPWWGATRPIPLDISIK